MTPFSLFLVLAAATPRPQLGTITFPVTGSKECQKQFKDGMLALHSFMYDDAHDFFRAALKADPNCTMARWGDAMAHLHPLWGEEDLKASQEQFNAIKDEAKLTPREKAFIQMSRPLFSDADYRSRLAGWVRATAAKHAEYPKDDEIALQHALALVANSERLTKQKPLMESVAISNDVLTRNAKHPGAAHYLIHAADTADHAVLALGAARAYSKIAPSASHALHMPAHTFAHLGMWSDVAASNEQSWAASELQKVKRNTPDDERAWHSYAWLTGSYLELGKLSKAEKLIADLRDLILKVDGSEMRLHYVFVVGAYVIHTGKWDQLDAMLAPVLRPVKLEPGEPTTSLGCALHAPGGSGKTRMPLGLLAHLKAQQLRAQAAARRGDDKGVAEAIALGKKVWPGMEPWNKMMAPDFYDRLARMEAATTSLAKAKKDKKKESWDAAIAAAKKLAEMHEPPGPAFEPTYLTLVAEVLMAAGRPQEALASYTAALDRLPMHAPALIGAARAAKAAGQNDVAAQHYSTLAEQWKNADTAHTLLTEVRSPVL
jgi:tetratricopeptide (TPR) repeat protein